MNITDVFYNNGQFNWDAISTIANSFLVLVLILVTIYYAREIKKQTQFIEKDRLSKEMDVLVAPLYAKIGNSNIFMKGASGYRASNNKQHLEYHSFWDKISENKYLGSDNLLFSIDDYLKNKSNTVGDNTRDPSYEKAEKELFEAIKKRYSELRISLKSA